jgi:hypothetical protein
MSIGSKTTGLIDEISFRLASEDEGKPATALSPATKPALLKDIDAVEVSRCVRMTGPGLDEYTEIWPEGEELPDANTMQGAPFFTVFLHYHPGGERQGLEALCDCPSSACAGLITALLEKALEA